MARDNRTRELSQYYTLQMPVAADLRSPLISFILQHAIFVELILIPHAFEAIRAAH